MESSHTGAGEARVGISLCLAAICLIVTSRAAAQRFDFPEAAPGDAAALSNALPALAGQVIELYKERNRDNYLNNLFRLQMVAGQYRDAIKSMIALRDLRGAGNPTASAWVYVQYEVYANARAQQDGEKLPFEQAFAQSFRDVFGRLDDKAALAAVRLFGSNQRAAQQDDLRAALNRQRGKNTIDLADALDLIRKYQVDQVYQAFLPLAPDLIAQEDQRRYLIQEDIPVKTREGATVAVMVVRSRAAIARLPTLLSFTIYAQRDGSLSEARLTAANGYAGAVAYTRGKGSSPDPPVAFEHDGSDAADVIDWISKQSWSDGRVGMYGGSYNSFAQWAATKHMPRALKALMPSASVAPGIDVPMEGNVFQSFFYPWPLYTTTGKLLDEDNYNDKARWEGLNRKWYTTGQPYRALEQIDGTPNPFFRRWLDHPSYDKYWQRMIPYRNDFARINIPVLTTDGYYDGGLIGALYYFTEHYKYNPRAEHYLVVGPYDHLGSQYGSVDVVQGYAIDPVARIDFRELRYQWFDYIFKGGPKPALLLDKVNYEVLGGNEWKHAPSLDAMSNGSLRLHLTAARLGDACLLTEYRPPGDAFIKQKIDFADRSDISRAISNLIVNKTVDTNNGIAFVSEPMSEPIEVSGLFSGRLDFVANKKDLDVNLQMYELTPNGEYFQLSYYMVRASYAKDRSHRRLLTPGKRQRLTFKSGRLTSRKFQAGSRLVLVLSIIKQPDIQINYGAGKDVSDEAIQDGKVPLEIKWYGDSYVDVPVWR